ncbi:MAG: hypothetical protein CL920_27040 [Deltaproteobacteria bacterium]|nr:hypothetical protein [Deltaproteobacteria bacterium]
MVLMISSCVLVTDQAQSENVLSMGMMASNERTFFTAICQARTTLSCLLSFSVSAFAERRLDTLQRCKRSAAAYAGFGECLFPKRVWVANPQSQASP